MKLLQMAAIGRENSRLHEQIDPANRARNTRQLGGNQNQRNAQYLTIMILIVLHMGTVHSGVLMAGVLLYRTS